MNLATVMPSTAHPVPSTGLQVAQDETLLPKGLKRKALHSSPTYLIHYFIIINISNNISSVTAMGQGA